MTKPDRALRPSYILTGDNIVEHIHSQQELKHQTRNYFLYSKLWRAIQDHISDNGLGEEHSFIKDSTTGESLRRHDINQVVLIDPPFDRTDENGCGDDYLAVKCYRGTGYSVSFRDAAIYGSSDQESTNAAQNMDLSFEVEWENSDESFTKNYTIKVPLALCKVKDDLLPEAFFDWILSLREEKVREQRRKDLKAIGKILSRYPTSTGLRQSYNELDDHES